MAAFMRAAQKASIAIAFVLLLGTIAYQAHLNFRMRQQIEGLQQREEPLAERNEFLETELTRLTNQLAEANQRFQHDTTDLLRLRAENSRLKSISGQQTRASDETVVPERTAARADIAMPEARLNEEQKRYLVEMTVNIKTKNSVADLDRLRDTLAQWDELVTNMGPAKMAAVVLALKQLVVERVMELEEAGQK
jgi:cell division protein FtsB